MKNFKKIGFGFLCLCLMVSFNFISLAKENQEESISKGSKLSNPTLGSIIYEVEATLNVREGPGLSCPIIGKLHQGDLIIVYYYGTNVDAYEWGQVDGVFNGDEDLLLGGYVAMDYLDVVGWLD